MRKKIFQLLILVAVVSIFSFISNMNQEYMTVGIELSNGYGTTNEMITQLNPQDGSRSAQVNVKVTGKQPTRAKYYIHIFHQDALDSSKFYYDTSTEFKKAIINYPNMTFWPGGSTDINKRYIIFALIDGTANYSSGNPASKLPDNIGFSKLDVFRTQ